LTTFDDDSALIHGVKAGARGNREIAEALVLREGTVKNHVSSIFSKLGAADRTKAVLRAIAAGLV
jgi:DNA-binding NarL/FixJ family response regulator